MSAQKDPLLDEVGDVILRMMQRGEVEQVDGKLRLTEKGKAAARADALGQIRG